MPIWNTRAPASATGTLTSQVLDISFAPVISHARLRGVQLSYPNTTTLIESNVSLNGGTSWLGWKTATLNNQFPDITPFVTNISNARLQLRFTFTATNTLAQPALQGLYVELKAAYPAEGYWYSPVYDFRNYLPKESSVVWDVVDIPAGTSIRMDWRTSFDGEFWLDWEEVETSTDAFPSSGLYMQLRAALIPDVNRLLSPSIRNIKLDASDFMFRGIWTSEERNISNIDDKTSGKLIPEYTSGGGALIVQSRKKNTLEEEWSRWYNSEADGTLTDGGGNFVQIRVLFSGYGSKVNEATLSFDGTPAATLLQSGLTPGAVYSFTTLRDKLIVANGKDAAMKWDGITGTLEPLGSAPPTLKMVLTHHNRVWGVDAENTSRVRYSNILDPETWGAFDFIDFNPEDGDFITAMLRYGQNLVVSKQRSQAILTGNRSSNYSISWLDSEQGVAGERGMCQADKYVAYVSQDGIRFTDLSNSVVATERLMPNWEDLNHRRLNQAAIAYWKNNLYVALPSKASLVNDVVWVYDFLRNSWSMCNGWTISAWLKFHQYGEDILLGADSMTGQVYQIATFDRADDGVLVDYEWRSKDFHFGHPERYKLFRNIFVDIEGVNETVDLEITLYVDGVATIPFTATIEAGEGIKHTRRILPPIQGAVLGRMLSVGIKGRCGIHGLTIEYVVRGAVPGGEF